MPLYDQDWDKRRQGDEFAPSSGKVPILWDGETLVWDSLAIIEHLNDKTGNERFWPTEVAARGTARAMAAEMRSSLLTIRREHSPNIRQNYTTQPPSAEPRHDIEPSTQPWAEATALFGAGGHCLCGAFGAAAPMNRTT